MVRLKELGKVEAERGQNSLESRSVFKIMPFQASDPLSVWVLADTTVLFASPHIVHAAWRAGCSGGM